MTQPDTTRPTHFVLLQDAFALDSLNIIGVVAQLVERFVRNEEVRGSTPLGSTNYLVIHLQETPLPLK